MVQIHPTLIRALKLKCRKNYFKSLVIKKCYYNVIIVLDVCEVYFYILLRKILEFRKYADCYSTS